MRDQAAVLQRGPVLGERARPESRAPHLLTVSVDNQQCETVAPYLFDERQPPNAGAFHFPDESSHSVVAAAPPRPPNAAPP